MATLHALPSRHTRGNGSHKVLKTDESYILSNAGFPFWLVAYRKGKILLVDDGLVCTEGVYTAWY